MSKPTKTQFGWTREGWRDHEKMEAYYDALKAWENRPRNPIPGRQRTRPIHPSWLPYLAKFQPVPGRSQGAFCESFGINRSSFSTMQTKPMPLHIKVDMDRWFEEQKIFRYEQSKH